MTLTLKCACWGPPWESSMATKEATQGRRRGRCYSHGLGLPAHLTWVASAQEAQGLGPRHPLPLSLHPVHPVGAKSREAGGGSPKA